KYARNASTIMARADQVSRGAPAEQQTHGIDDDRLAAAGFTSEQVQSGMEADAQPVHYRIILDQELDEHFSVLWHSAESIGTLNRLLTRCGSVRDPDRPKHFSFNLF